MNVYSLAGVNASLVIMKKQLFCDDWKKIQPEEFIIRYQTTLLCIIGFISTDPEMKDLKDIVEEEYINLNDNNSRKDILLSILKIRKQLIFKNTGIKVYDEKYEKIY